MTAGGQGGRVAPCAFRGAHCLPPPVPPSAVTKHNIEAGWGGALLGETMLGSMAAAVSAAMGSKRAAAKLELSDLLARLPRDVPVDGKRMPPAEAAGAHSAFAPQGPAPGLGPACGPAGWPAHPCAAPAPACSPVRDVQGALQRPAARLARPVRPAGAQRRAARACGDVCGTLQVIRARAGRAERPDVRACVCAGSTQAATRPLASRPPLCTGLAPRCACRGEVQFKWEYDQYCKRPPADWASQWCARDPPAAGSPPCTRALCMCRDAPAPPGPLPRCLALSATPSRSPRSAAARCCGRRRWAATQQRRSTT